MQQLSSLIILIHSLSKSEKRHFQMATNLQAGDKKYWYLFRLIEADCPFEDIYGRFCAQYPESSFEIATKYLYRNLMDCLIYLRRKRDIQYRVFTLLSEADILFERALYDDALDLLDKAKKTASTYEMDSLTLLARRNELKYLNALDFNHISERQLIGKQMKIMETMKYIRSTNLHAQLYDILKYRLFHKGYVRSEKQQEALNDLILSELNLIAQDSYKGFETQKLHLLFQSTYYLDSGNYKMAVRFYRTLIGLFEKNRHMILNPPIYYLQALTGILDSLNAAGLYREMPFFIDKLKEIEQGDYATDFVLHVHACIYLYRFAGTFNSGDFTGAEALIAEHKESLFKSLPQLRLDMQLDLLLTITKTNMAAGNYAEMRRNMKKIVGSGKLFYPLPAYYYARLLNLLMQAELENYDVIESEINSIKRNASREKNMYVTEKLLFRFVMQHQLLSRAKPREQLLKRLHRERVRISRSKYDRQLLVFFDFLSWMESKLSNRPFGELLAQQVILEQN